MIARPIRAALLRRGHRWEFALGIRPLRWGAADGGDLLLGRSALPRAGVSAATTRRLDLPFVPPSWGTWTGDVFLQYLDDEPRLISRPLLFGHRSEWQPRPYLSLGFSRTILFGGEDRTSRLNAGDLVDIFFGIDENKTGERPPSDSDQKAALHGRLAWPTLGRWRDVELSYVYAGEDALHGVFPSAIAHQWTLGAATGALAFRLESTETNTGANRWYTHTIYGPAYFYRRLPIGWPYGAGSKIFSGSIGGQTGQWIFATRLTDERMRARNDWRSHRTRVEAWVSLACGARDRIEFGLEATGIPNADSRSMIDDRRRNPPLETPLDPLDPIGVQSRAVISWTRSWDRRTASELLPPSMGRALAHCGPG